jgi:hypothetical protein
MLNVTDEVAQQVEQADQYTIWEFLCNCSLPGNRRDEIQDTFTELCRQMIVGEPSANTIKLLQQSVRDGAGRYFTIS